MADDFRLKSTVFRQEREPSWRELEILIQRWESRGLHGLSAAQALRLAAAALRSSQSALGAYFRRMCSRMDKPKAIAAAAHKLARLIYTMLTKGEEYTDQGQDYYEERYRERVLRQLSKRAKTLGMKLVATEQPA